MKTALKMSLDDLAIAYDNFDPLAVNSMVNLIAHVRVAVEVYRDTCGNLPEGVMVGDTSTCHHLTD